MQDLIESARRLIEQAEFILIGAGAGMSVDAGYDYNEREEFLRNYPYLEKIGVHSRYHSIGFAWPSKSIQWAFYARHLQDVLYTPPPNPAPYQQLNALTRHANRFVLTSNADNLFARMGFAREKLWTRQGNYAHLQCLEPCSEGVWDARPTIEAILPHIDYQTGELNDDTLIPSCPRCGGPVSLNVRGGSWFIETPYREQERRFKMWLENTHKGQLVLVDVGTGFSTPSVVRWPMEQITATHHDATLIRVNPDYPEVHPSIANRSIRISQTGADFFNAISAAATMR